MQSRPGALASLSSQASANKKLSRWLVRPLSPGDFTVTRGRLLNFLVKHPFYRAPVLASGMLHWSLLPCSCNVEGSPDFWNSQISPLGASAKTPQCCLFITLCIRQPDTQRAEETAQTGTQNCLHISALTLLPPFVLEMQEQSNDPMTASEKGGESPCHASLELRLIWPTTSLTGSGSACRGGTWLGSGRKEGFILQSAQSCSCFGTCEDSGWVQYYSWPSTAILEGWESHLLLQWSDSLRTMDIRHACHSANLPQKDPS